MDFELEAVSDQEEQDELLVLLFRRCLSVVRRARQRYGDQQQDTKCAEECAECICAILQEAAGHGASWKVGEEAADAFITSLSVVLSRDAMHWIEMKLDRLEGRLDNDLDPETRRTIPTIPAPSE